MDAATNPTPPTPTTSDTALSGAITSPRGRKIAQALWWSVLAICVTAVVTFIPGLHDVIHNRLSADEIADINRLGISRDGLFVYNVAVLLVQFGISLAVAALIFFRRRDDRMAVFTAIFVTVFGTASMSDTHLTITQNADFALKPVFAVSATITTGLCWILLGPFVALFPDGRFAPPFVRYVAVVAVIFTTFWGFFSEDFNQPTGVLAVIVPIGTTFMLGGLLYGQVHRYRHISSPLQRQQTKWFVLGMGIIFILSFCYIVASVPLPSDEESTTRTLYHFLSPLVYFVGLALPITIGFAMLRHRLWDVDVIINRSLVYGAITVLTVGIFVLALLALQVIAGNTQPVIALAIAVAVAAAIYRPVQRRVQGFVDHRIYGLKFDLNELQAAQKRPAVKNPGALTGRRLGEYDVLDVVGRGGMGEVYKGSSGGQMVAIKVLPDDLAEQHEYRARFSREAQTGMRLDHPHIARVYAAGETDGVHFIAMQYIDGIDLSHHLKQHGPMALDDMRETLTGVADALDFAHKSGLVHRDLKPSNVMLRANSDNETYTAILMDFGVARIDDGRTRFTGTGAVGTIDYMAPEQIMAARDVDARADIYALGVMAYEMVTGERPFKGGPAQVMFAHLNQPPPDPRDIDPDVPRKAAKAVMRAMAKAPEDRFETASAFVAALQ